MKNNNPIFYIRGMSLIETMVAIGVLILAISGPLFLAYDGISYSRLSKDQTTAVFLAQDAIEYVVAVKEYNITANTFSNWLDNLDDCQNGCTVDTTREVYDGSAIIPCAGACVPLKLSNGIYNYTGTPEEVTHFVRTVRIENVPDNSGEKKVTVIVDFKSGLFNRSVNLKTNIYQISI